jgi:hypothetical protein
MHEDSQGAAGGSYLFDTEERARAWGDESMPASLGRLPGVSNIQARYSTLTSLERDYTGPLFATEEV